MNKLIANVFLVLVATASMLGLTASSARADEDQVIAKVPFAFMVGKARLPAGDYRVREASIDGSIISITNADGREVALAPTFPLTTVTNAGQAEGPELVFEKVNGQYYLARVVSGDGSREIASTVITLEHAAAGAPR